MTFQVLLQSYWPLDNDCFRCVTILYCPFDNNCFKQFSVLLPFRQMFQLLLQSYCPLEDKCLRYIAVLNCPLARNASSSLQCYYPFDNCFRCHYRVTVVSKTTASGIWQTHCHFNCNGFKFFKCTVYLKTWKLSCVCVKTWKHNCVPENMKTKLCLC